MWGLAFGSIRHNRSGYIGAFVSVLLAAILITALGVLTESGLRGGVAPTRFAGADVIVGAQQSSGSGVDSQPFPERATLPADVVERIADVAGVKRAVGDITVPLTTIGASGKNGTSGAELVDGHGWSSATLTPYSLKAGVAPSGPSQIVVDQSFGLAPGARIELADGGIPASYTVVGIARAVGAARTATDPAPPATVFLSDAAAEKLAPHPGRIDVVGVVAQKGVDASSLATAIGAKVRDSETYTGMRRGDVQTLGSYGARSQLTALSGSFAGVALMIALFVLASTLSLAVAQRRRDFALLRAVGTSPGQIHAMVARETALVAAAATLIGVGPGYWLAGILAAQFEGTGVIPADFVLAYSPLPAVAAVILSLATALGAAAIAARRSANIAPVDALRESLVEPPSLGRGRIVTGLVLFGSGLAASAVPLVVAGTIGLAGAASAALMLIVAVGLLGPLIVRGAVNLIGRFLRRSNSASVVLAEANAREYTRRLASAIVPLALAITFGCVQLFVPTTVAAAATTQTQQGVTARYLVAAPASGISPRLVTRVSKLTGVTTVDPVVRSSVLLTSTLDGPSSGEGDADVEPYSAQGIDPGSVHGTLDLRVVDGSLASLDKPNTVALSTDAASMVGAHVGGRTTFSLGDGTSMTATVVATYGRGLGFGDVTMDGAVLRQHTTTGLNDYLLVSTATAHSARVAQEIRALGLAVHDQHALAAAGASDRDMQSSVSAIALAVILGYIALSVVNTLVIATTERRREFTLLRLIGGTDRQVGRMTLVESLLAVLIAVVVGTVISVPPLIGIAIGVSHQPVPTVPPLIYLGIVIVTMALGVVSIALATRASLRRTLAL